MHFSSVGETDQRLIARQAKLALTIWTDKVNALDHPERTVCLLISMKNVRNRLCVGHMEGLVLACFSTFENRAGRTISITRAAKGAGYAVSSLTSLPPSLITRKFSVPLITVRTELSAK